MISLRNIHLSYGEQVLFKGASLQINEGDRLALVGPNGAGKSTVFRMILGEIRPDEGVIQTRKGLIIGHLPQENAPVSNRPVLAETMAGSGAKDERLAAKAKKILMGLGFRIADFERPLKEMSGGWAMRVAMARLLLKEPHVLLLDEPTNHLDLLSLLWFRDYLVGYQGTIVVISHDRNFINTVCHSIVSVQDGSLEVYPGSYEAFEGQRAAELERLEAAQQAQRKKIKEMEDFIARNRARLSTARRAQSMMKRLEKVERIEMPDKTKELRIVLPQPSRSGKETIALRKVGKSYGKIGVFRDLDFSILRGWKMAFVGQNGAGKSTLLRILAGVLPFESGERVAGHNVTVGYHSQHRAETMNPLNSVLEEAKAANPANPVQLVRTVLGSFLFPGDDQFKQVRVLSGGEKSRLSLVRILLDPPNLLLLDEPTTHLDMASVTTLIEALKSFEGTMAFISHDVHFINSVADRIVYFQNGKLTVFPGNLDLFLWSQKKKGLTFW